MNKVSKVLVDELLKKNRLLWREPYPSRKERSQLVSASCEINHKLREEVKFEGFIDFDDLAYLVARNNLSDECYYEMLKLCGVEVHQ